MSVTARDARPRLTFRALWINTAILSCSILLSLALAEFMARRFVDISGWPPFYVGEYENRESENFIADEDTGWRMRSGHSFVWQIGEKSEANAYTANAEGFRSDKAFSQQGPVVLVGDSFTFGTGVPYEHTFGAVLEKRLGGSPVYNFAMPGFGIDQMWMAVQHQALRFDPKLVVVAFIDEDFERSLTAFRKFEGFNKPSFVLEDGALRLQTPADQPQSLIKYLRRNLVLASVLSQNLEQLGHHLPQGSWWTLNAAILQQLALDARDKQVPVLFVRLPSRGQGEFATLSFLMKDMAAPYLDLQAITRDYAEEEIFIPGDGHINAQGHQLVADAIFKWMSANQVGFGH